MHCSLPALTKQHFGIYRDRRFIGSAYGPSLPNGWELVGAADFNGDNKPDYVLYNAITRQTAIWYINNNVHIGGGYGPTLPPGWNLIGVGDFNGDGHPDYPLVYTSTGQTAIGYLSGLTLIAAPRGQLFPVAGYSRPQPTLTATPVQTLHFIRLALVRRQSGI